MKWISVKDRLPDDGDWVLAAGYGKQRDQVQRWVFEAEYKNTHFFDLAVRDYAGDPTECDNVSHWMPLPEPPNGE